MSILRLSTLSLTLAIAVFALGYVNSAFARPVDCSAALNSTHPKCKNKEATGGSITYTVALEGAFAFGAVPVDVGGAHGQELTPDDTVATFDMTRPVAADPLLRATWDNVFTMPNPDPCDLLGPSGSVDFFRVHKKEKHVHGGWGAARPGGVGIILGEHVLESDDTSAAGGDDVDVFLSLIGNCEYSGGTDPNCPPFLPVPVDTVPMGNTLVGISEIPLVKFWIHANKLKGAPNFEGCHGAHTALVNPGVAPSTLVITATKCKFGGTPPESCTPP